VKGKGKGKGIITYPPTIEDIKNDAPRFVWRPSPRRERVKIVGKRQDSKKRTSERQARPPLPGIAMARMINTTQPIYQHRNMMRGCTHRIRNVAKNRPIVKSA
jgi:hypothetical protein